MTSLPLDDWLALSLEDRLKHVSLSKLQQIRNDLIYRFESGEYLSDHMLDGYLVLKKELNRRDRCIPDGAFVDPKTNKKI